MMRVNQANVSIDSARVRVLVGFTVEGPEANEFLHNVDNRLRAMPGARDLTLGQWNRKTIKSPGTCAASEYYTEDYYEHANRFLFEGAGQAGCSYWHYTETTAIEWLANCRLTVCDPKAVAEELDLQNLFFEEHGLTQHPVRLANNSGIELFISRAGVGVLSISLEFTEPLTESDLRTINHELATNQKAVWISKSGFDNPRHRIQPAAAIAPADRSKEADQPNTTQADFVTRLTEPRHAFRFEELVDWLLSPVAGARGFSVRRDPRNFIYSTIHLGKEIDFHDAATCESVRNALSHLAQVHTVSHPGEIERTSQAVSINSKHIAAVSLAGAAHAVARQTPPEGKDQHDYDKTQQLRAHVNYFSGYLLALIQRLVIQQVLNESGELLSARQNVLLEQDEATREDKQSPIDIRFADLQRRVMSFCVEGEFVLVSWRRTVQQFHEVSQTVSQIPQGIDAIRRELNDWESARQAETMAQSLVAMHQLQAKAEQQNETITHSLHAIENMQNKIEWLEVFIVLVYAIELGHVAAVTFGWAHSWWLGLTLLLFSVLGGLIGYFSLRPFEHASDKTKKGMKRLASLLAIAFVAFLFANCSWTKEQLRNHGLDIPEDHQEHKENAIDGEHNEAHGHAMEEAEATKSDAIETRSQTIDH